MNAKTGERTISVPRIAQDTGMVGSPAMGAPTEEGGPPVLTVTSLLRPDLRLRGRVTVESKATTGQFVCQRVIHQGDTHGQQWYTMIEATAA